MKYQLVVLGPGRKRFARKLRSELTKRISDVGLNPRSDFETLTGGAAAKRVSWDGLLVGIWFGANESPAKADLDLLRKMLDEAYSVFPVVEDRERFTELVPAELHRINGMDWEPSRLVSEILKVFRLTRAQRQAFISYKRNESRGVAVQLFEALSHRGYRPFLDTGSVEAGDDFQEALWGRMADVDLLIFLDSPNALTSRWVYEELARAQALGLGVLQLVWPRHQRTSGTEFCDCLELKATDFKSRRTKQHGQLTEATLERTLTAVEQSRIRSLSARRERVVVDLVKQVEIAGLTATVQPAGPVQLQCGESGRSLGQIVPFIGLPDALSIQQTEQDFEACSLASVRVVYDALGIREEWQRHLDWLNQRHLLKTTGIQFVSGWLGELK